MRVAYPHVCPACRPSLALDKLSPKSAFIRARKAEDAYARQLLKVASWIDALVRELFDPADPSAANAIGEALNGYSRHIGDWAHSVANRMVTEVAARDRRAWIEMSSKMGRVLRAEIDSAPVGEVMRSRLAEQVRLITSLPTEAAERVHKLTLEGIVQGTRAEEIAAEIMRSGEVARSRARLIARTEVSRTATDLTQARAEHIGSPGYLWRTAGDGDVRDSHRKMAGKFVAWGAPPTLDGMTGHAGQFPNCRCYPEPILEDA